MQHSICPPHGQQRAGAIERLDFDPAKTACPGSRSGPSRRAQHQRTIRRRQVQAHDAAHLFAEERIAVQLEGFRAMRRERKGAPNAADSGLAQTAGPSWVGGGPVRGRFRPALEGARQHLLDVPAVQLACGVWARS